MSRTTNKAESRAASQAESRAASQAVKKAATDYTIVTDSTCDLPVDMIERYGLKVALLSVILDGKTYKNYPDGREITNRELYAAMRDKKLPTTSAVNPEEFLEIMEPELKAGRDILYIGFSGAMSCTFNSARTAAAELLESYPERRIVMVDSFSASFGQGLLAILTAMKKEQGADLDEAAAYAEENRMWMSHSFTVDDLFHIMRGGRVSKAGAVIGSILALKPILTVNREGLIESVRTIRGHRKALRELASDIAATATDKSMPLFVGHGDCEEEAEGFAAVLRDEYGFTDVRVCYIGAVCGCHGGPGLIGAFYHGSVRIPASAMQNAV